MMYVLWGHTDQGGWTDAAETFISLQCDDPLVSLRRSLKHHLTCVLAGRDEPPFEAAQREQIDSILNAAITLLIGGQKTVTYEEPYSTGTVAWGFTVTRFDYA